jgi:hypothetical protein
MEETNEQIEYRKKQFKISQLLYLANSRYGAKGEYPSIDDQKKIYQEIYDIRKSLKK